MAYSKIITPLRQSLAVISSSSSNPSCFQYLLYAKSEPLKRLVKSFEHVQRSRVSGFQWKSNNLKFSLRSNHFSGNSIRVGAGILAVSAIFGSNILLPRVSYAMDGLDVLTQDETQSWNDSGEVKTQSMFWKLVKKFWLPFFFSVTVLSRLGDPFAMIVSQVILFLVSTKPSPFSVYISVNELCDRSMRDEPHLYNVKSLYAHKVEVQDYKLLCIARVEIRDQEFSLVGILGGWWPLPKVSHGTFSLLRLRALNFLEALTTTRFEITVMCGKITPHML